MTAASRWRTAAWAARRRSSCCRSCGPATGFPPTCTSNLLPCTGTARPQHQAHSRTARGNIDRWQSLGRFHFAVSEPPICGGFCTPVCVAVTRRQACHSRDGQLYDEACGECGVRSVGNSSVAYTR